jgi:arabinose-5-phosphate isomerase
VVSHDGSGSNLKEYFEVVFQEMEAFRRNLDQRSIESLVRSLNEAQGPLVFLGIGSSEINAKRAQHLCNTIGKPSIAPTVSSLLHGGIGGLAFSDAIVIFSKSGLTDEILRLIRLIDAQRYRLFLVTENEKLQESEVNLYHQVLVLGKSIEADINRVLPTTSNLKVNMFIDLLARGLQYELDTNVNLETNHPGGMLGRFSNLSLFEALDDKWKLRHVGEDSTLREILERITIFGIGGISITAKDFNLVGIISDGDVRRTLVNEKLDLSSLGVQKICHRQPVVLRGDMTVEEAIHLVNQHRHLSFFPVIKQDGAFIATVSSREILTLSLSGI